MITGSLSHSEESRAPATQRFEASARRTHPTSKRAAGINQTGIHPRGAQRGQPYNSRILCWNEKPILNIYRGFYRARQPGIIGLTSLYHRSFGRMRISPVKRNQSSDKLTASECRLNPQDFVHFPASDNSAPPGLRPGLPAADRTGTPGLPRAICSFRQC